MNSRIFPISMDELFSRRMETINDAASVRFDREPAWNFMEPPALKPDEQALHETLVGIAHPTGEEADSQNLHSVPAEVFLG